MLTYGSDSDSLRPDESQLLVKPDIEVRHERTAVKSPMQTA